MTESTGTRLDRIESKLDQLTEAMITLARAEEKLAGLKQDHERSFERMNKFSAKLDDIDVWSAVKFWTDSEDLVLSFLCKSILARNLFKIEIANTQFDLDYVDHLSKQLAQNNNLTMLDVQYLILSGQATNEAYVSQGESIRVKSKSGELIDVAEASDLPNIKAISKLVTKHYIAYPKKLSL